MCHVQRFGNAMSIVVSGQDVDAASALLRQVCPRVMDVRLHQYALTCVRLSSAGKREQD